jgi:hypothetical protein
LEAQRESLRGLANLSSNFENVVFMISDGIITTLLNGLISSDFLLQRYGVLGFSNLTSSASTHSQILQEGSFKLLMSLMKFDSGDVKTQRYATISLANLSSLSLNHELLIANNCILVFISYFNHSDKEIRNSSILAVANLSTGINNQEEIMKLLPFDQIIEYFDSSIVLICGIQHDGQISRIMNVSLSDNDHLTVEAILYHLKVIRNLSSNLLLHDRLLSKSRLFPILLKLAKVNIAEISNEAMMIICNFCKSGVMADMYDSVLSIFLLEEIIDFIIGDDEVSCLFGVICFGNIFPLITSTSSEILQEYITTIVKTSHTMSKETLRCVAL